MTRSEAIGLAVAAIGHIGLFVFLSPAMAPAPEKLVSTPIAVSFADDVALESSAPVISSEEEAAKKSPVEAPVEPDSAPPEPVSEPEPAARPQPAPPKPAPAPAEKPKPAPPSKPAPATKPAPPAKTAAAAPPSNPRSQPRRDVRPTGNLEGLDLGRTNNRNNGTASTPPAAMTGQAAADIGSAIQRQVQPCADRQVNPGPGADQIRVVVNLRINRDGSLAGAPRIVGHTGVDDTNQRYVTRVDDAVRAIFAGCSPLRGLPADLYDVPNGWKSFTLRYRLKS
ncbi:cell envelope biogenesis protein TolA [Sphingomonas naasensis]|uniref:Cell envelope biogenesis protein TolA n=1 Tax=Sphingomonas naasensis TaxID=1344951 RepID=A0A4S1WEW4_9SPHN|nr:cell envelope biogenesis protein TolA [Sphingomonas naasensis]TGX40167.1 cell envelope biogenesis protein TolA [Sphingomonas naasensis]